MIPYSIKMLVRKIKPDSKIYNLLWLVNPRELCRSSQAMASIDKLKYIYSKRTQRSLCFSVWGAHDYAVYCADALFPLIWNLAKVRQFTYPFLYSRLYMVLFNTRRNQYWLFFYLHTTNSIFNPKTGLFLMWKNIN